MTPGRCHARDGTGASESGGPLPGTLSPGNCRPTNAAEAVHAELPDKIEAEFANFDDLIQADVAAFDSLLKANGGVIAGKAHYLDECDLHIHSHSVQVWQRHGSSLTVPVAGADQRRAVFGAIHDASGQVSWHLAERKGGGFAAFLAQVAALEQAAATLLSKLEAHFHAPTQPRMFLRKNVRIAA